MQSAIPIPPPIHKDAQPFLAPLLCIEYNRVTRIRQPKMNENIDKMITFLNQKLEFMDDVPSSQQSAKTLSSPDRMKLFISFCNIFSIMFHRPIS